MSTSRNEVVFLDSSVIIRYFLGDNTARNIIEDSARFAINSIVYSDASFNLLKLLYIEKHGKYKFYDMKSNLSKRDARLLEGYNILYSFMKELLEEDRLVFLPITIEIIEEAMRIGERYGLLPNDSLIAATCKHYGITTLATFDEDFRRILWLKVVP